MRKIKNELEKKGFFKISEGVFLESQEQIIKDQKKWKKDDRNKNMDFSSHPYWIVIADDDIEPCGFFP